MKTAMIVSDAVTVILILSTVVCGLWIKAQPAVEVSSVNFHLTIALVTAGFVILSLTVAAFAAFRAAA